jgi:hypothetical protein
MNRSLILIVAFAFLFGSAAGQRSDRAIVDAFEQNVKIILRSIDSAQTVQDCASLRAEIDELETEQKPEQNLLDKALFPEDFAATFVRLRDRLKIRQTDLGVIETQFTRVTELEVQVRELSGQVLLLTTENAKLIADIDKMAENIRVFSRGAVADQRTIDSLRSMVKKLQQNLSDRDALVFALVDSIFLQYGKQVADLNDVEKRGVVAKLERQNVLTSVKRSIAENLKFLESTALKGNDFAEIAKQKEAFQRQWQGLGPKIAQVYYSGKRRTNEVALIDSMLASWGAKVDERLWLTLGALFKERGFSLQPFTDGEQFYNGFMLLVQDEIRNVRNEQPNPRLKLFQNFETDLWLSDLKPTWLPALVETGKLTSGQVEQIEEKIDEWRDAVSEISWVAYALIAAITFVVGWIILRLFVWKPAKKNPAV